MKVKITVEVPDDLLPLRSREWFRSEFEEACKQHVTVVRTMLAPPKRRRRTKKKAPRTDQGDGQ